MNNLNKNIPKEYIADDFEKMKKMNGSIDKSYKNYVEDYLVKH